LNLSEANAGELLTLAQQFKVGSYWYGRRDRDGPAYWDLANYLGDRGATLRSLAQGRPHETLGSVDWKYVKLAPDVAPGLEVFRVVSLSEWNGEPEIHIRDLAAKRTVRYRVGDGWAGWPEEAPFDAVCVTAAASEIPAPLTDQLAVGGRMIIPVGTALQELVLVRRQKKGMTRERLLPVRFVPLIRRS